MSTTSTGVTGSERQQSIKWFRRLVAPPLSLLLAILGQWFFTQPFPNFLAGAICYGFGIILFLVTLIGWPPAALKAPSTAPVFPTSRPFVHRTETRLIYVVAVVILSAMAFFGFADNWLLGGVWPWLAAIVLFVVAFAEVPDLKREDLGHALHSWWQKINKRALAVLVLITLISIFFRVYRLPDVPAEMTSDHAEKLLDVQEILNGQRPIFFPRNTGREAIQFYLTAALVRFTPLQMSHLALKVGTAIVGIVTIPFAYLIGRQFFGTLAGLIAAFLMAVSHWHIAITRVGLRFPFTAAFATPALYFLFRAFRNNRRNDWLAASLFLGIGLHTYTAMRIVPLLFLILISLRLAMDGWQILGNRPLPGVNSWRHDFLTNAFLGGIFTILLFLPLLRVIVDDPEAFWLRMASRTQVSETPALTELIPLLLNNLKNALLMFNVKGDDVVVNTIPGSPVLGTISAALFLLGIFYLLWRLILHRDRRSLYVLVTLLFLLLPSILSLAYPQENPSVVRTGGAIPWAMLVAALPLTITILRLNSLPATSGKLTVGLLLVALGAATILYNFNWYFVRYDAIIRRSLWNSSEMGMVMQEFVQEGGDLGNIYHVPYPHWVDTRNIGINAGYIGWANSVDEHEWPVLHALNGKPKLFLLFPDDKRNVRRLQFFFPRGQIEIYDSSREGKDFIIYRVP